MIDQRRNDKTYRITRTNDTAEDIQVSSLEISNEGQARFYGVAETGSWVPLLVLRADEYRRIELIPTIGDES